MRNPVKNESVMLKTNLKTSSRIVSLIGSVCLVLGLGACASLADPDPASEVKVRAEERLQLQVTGEFGKIYDYYAPSYRAAVTKEQFVGRFGGAVKWVDAKVISVICNKPDECTARVRVDYHAMFRRNVETPLTTHFNETWVQESGRWWLTEPIGRKPMKPPV
jgi:hypothetical protein